MRSALSGWVQGCTSLKLIGRFITIMENKPFIFKERCLRNIRLFTRVIIHSSLHSFNKVTRRWSSHRPQGADQTQFRHLYVHTIAWIPSTRTIMHWPAIKRWIGISVHSFGVYIGLMTWSCCDVDVDDGQRVVLIDEEGSYFCIYMGRFCSCRHGFVEAVLWAALG